MTFDPRHLPQIQTLLVQPYIAALVADSSHAEVAHALRGALQSLRSEILGGKEITLPDFAGTAFAQRIKAGIVSGRSPHLRAVINATGILIHTNLGRSRLAPEALQQMVRVAAGATNLELNLDSGKRGSRGAHVEALICDLTGAEAALVVNNCAAAVLLSLTALAQGRNVIASRGELIEIGGSFRLPDVIAGSGAVLREVGATNKTRVDDYARAIDENTAVLLKSHTSNYRIVGFTSSPTRNELAVLAHDTGVVLIEDLGSGILMDLSAHGLGDEPVVADILKSGVDLVMFSGDKLLGGPQAGIIAGRADVIEKLRTHSMLRAVRIDKLSLAALEATLRLYKPPHDPLRDIPVLRMLSTSLEDLQHLAETFAQGLLDLGVSDVSVIESAAYVGGGALPQKDLRSMAVSLALPGMTAEALSTALRAADIPVIGRISQDRVHLDMRSLEGADLPVILDALRYIVS